MTTDPASVPVPFDLCSWDGTVEPAQPLTRFQEALIASVVPGRGRVLDVRPHRRWDGRLMFPVYALVVAASDEPDEPDEPDGPGEADGQKVLLRMERYRGGVENEANVLPILTRLGLPVPQVLAGPAIDPEFPDRGAVSILSVLPGTDCQHLSISAPAERIAALGALIFTGVEMLHNATCRRPCAPILPARRCPPCR